MTKVILRKLITLGLLGLALVECTGQTTTVSDVGSFKGLKYTVLSKNVALADGNTDLTMELLVQDLMGNVLSGYVPNIQYPKNSGINYLSCTASDVQGHSTCVLRSILDGSWELTIGANTKTEVTFTAADSRTLRLSTIVPSFDTGTSIELTESATGQRGLASVGAVISSSVGNIVDKPKQRTSDWIFYADNAIRQ